MKKTIEIAFGLFALALIYVIITHNASITGFVIGPPASITLVAPAENTQTTQSVIAFTFQYPSELEIKECSLLLNNEVVKTTTTMLSPQGTRMLLDLDPADYVWSVECTNKNDFIISSETRRLIIGTGADPNVKKTSIPGKPGTIYEFEIKQGFKLAINGLIINDVIRAKRQGNAYDATVLRVAQDYSKGLEFAELMVTPGNKRIRLSQGDSTSIDFNNDAQDDIILTLYDVSYSKASFIVSNPEASEEQQPQITIRSVNPAKQQPALITDKERSGSLPELFLIGAIIVLAIAIIIALKSKALDKEKEYVTKLKQKTPAKAKTAAKKAKPKKAKRKAARKARAKKKKVKKRAIKTRAATKKKTIKKKIKRRKK
jgi:hypothetical protein